MERLKNAAATKVQARREYLIEKVSKYVFYKKYAIQILEMQQWSMSEVVSIFPITSHFDFSPLIAVFLEISSQAFYF